MWIYVWDTEIKWIYLWDTPVKEVYLWDTKIRPSMINFATQWPCPDGFHVPLRSEFKWLINRMNWWWIGWSNDWITYLHFPRGWSRIATNSATTDQRNFGNFWTCEPHSNLGRAYLVSMSTTSWWAYETYWYRASWYSIRWFKNKFAVPTSTRTVIYWTLWGAWIFWDTVNWIISITNNWSTWCTIMDKNLWATTVYNFWDFVSEANCWKYYQRWNNYWFPFTWSVTTSSTQVNAWAYWPWNYYSSSTFITIGWSWDSSFNNNLRWWVDGNVPV